MELDKVAELGLAESAPRRGQMLMSPGPTRIPPPVLQALSQPILHHRAPDFQAALRRVRAGLQEIACTENEVVLLACTGTAAMESAVVNLCDRGDAVAVVAAGYFGERWITLAERYGCDVVPVRYEWGSIPSADDLHRALLARPDVQSVFVVHSETSTGVVIDLEAFAAAAKSAGALFVVDTVSSFAAVPIEVDAWGIDVLVSSSHKALMTPPGIAFVIPSQAALEVARRTSTPRYYLDWEPNLGPQLADNPETWFSAAVSLVVGLDVALSCIRAEGLDAVHKRHVRLGRRCRAGVKALGLELFSPDDDSAAIMTAVRMPAGVDSSAIVRAMYDSGVTVADGEARLKGRIIRVGHLGHVGDDDVEQAVAALGAAIAANTPALEADVA